MNFSDYCAIDALSSGDLKALLKSPLHYKNKNRNGATSYQRSGDHVHRGALEPDLYLGNLRAYPGKSRRGAAWEAYKEANADVDPDMIVIASELEAIRGMLASLRKHGEAMRCLTTGTQETTLTWEDPDTGVRCKARPDNLNGSALIDLKTVNARSFSPHRFMSHVLSFGYDVQLSFYLDGARANGFPVNEVRLVAVESERPHDVAVYRIADAVLSRGRERYKQALRTFVECTENDHWPGVAGSTVIELELPAWAQTEETKDADTAQGDKT